MSASRQEIQALADQILEHLGSRVRSGQMVIHFADGIVQRVEISTAHKLVTQQQRQTPTLAVDTAMR